MGLPGNSCGCLKLIEQAASSNLQAQLAWGNHMTIESFLYIFFFPPILSWLPLCSWRGVVIMVCTQAHRQGQTLTMPVTLLQLSVPQNLDWYSIQSGSWSPGLTLVISESHGPVCIIIFNLECVLPQCPSLERAPHVQKEIGRAHV